LKNPKVSILLACYNDEKYIEKSVRSVLSQTYGDFELLVGFNGTIDNSINIVNAIKEKTSDDRIIIFNYGDDKGKAKTLNKLLKEAKGEWIAIQDGDDMWLKEKLEKQMEYVEKYNVIGSFINYIDKKDCVIGAADLSVNSEDIIKKSTSGANQVANTSAIVKKDLCINVNGWSEEIEGIEDYDFWLKIMKINTGFYNIPTVLVHHRLHNDSNFNTKQYDINSLIEKHKNN